MELRLRQLREAVASDPMGRVAGVRDLLDEIESRADEMCLAERLHHEGRLLQTAYATVTQRSTT